MANIPKEMTKRFEERSQVHREQQDMLQVQQESINDFKKMISLLLDKKSKDFKTDASSSKSKRTEGG